MKEKVSLQPMPVKLPGMALFCLNLIVFLSLGMDHSVLSQNPQGGSRKTDSHSHDHQRIVVLTFDDASASHFEVVRPLLLKYKFGATFFITEGWDFSTNKKDYMTWDQIRLLEQDGFEIGNHTKDHLGITDKTVNQLDKQLTAIEDQCDAHGIQKPVSFAWPGNRITAAAFPILKRHGILFARRGGGPEYPYDLGMGFAYEPRMDHPYLIPSAGAARPDWQIDDLIRAVEKSEKERISVLQFHGVPDTAHNWVSSSPDKFEAYLRYLAINQFKVIALRDLKDHVDPSHWPEDPFKIIEERKSRLTEQEK